MKVLDRKLWRDLGRLKMQSFAIALVMACGVATLILAASAMRSLEDTQSAFYERYRFGHVFGAATRAPLHLADRIKRISGVAVIEQRIYHPVLLDIIGMAEPGSGVVVSVPDTGTSLLNQLYMRSGRLPVASRPNEVAVLEAFANAHGFVAGDSFHAIMNGHKRELRIVGIVLSPEFVYAIGPGDMVPDQRRFGVFFMPYSVLAGVFDMEGAFNQVSMTTSRSTDNDRVVEALDDILEPYGGSGAHARKDQISHAFLDNELKQLRGTVTVVPPIFLIISAFLVNMILSRLIALEREQIGLLKAVGYQGSAIAWHYAKLVLIIAVFGWLIGSILGTWLGHSLTRLYGEFFTFPFLIFRSNLDLYIIAGVVTLVAALAGAVQAIVKTAVLSPAVAMRAPAPVRYRSLFPGEQFLIRWFSQLSVMAIRHLVRWPVRSALTILGTSMSVAVLVASLFAYDSIDFMIDTVFFRSNRQDATLMFTRDLGNSSAERVAALPAVIRVEPFRDTPVVLRRDHLEKKLRLLGMREDAVLARILDTDLNPITIPATGLVVSERVASGLGLKVGDHIEVELLKKDNRRLLLPVTGIANSFIGISAYMSMDAMTRMMMDGRRYSGAEVLVDPLNINALYDAVKETPNIAGIALLRLSLKSFRKTIEQNISIMTSVYIALAIVITFGVIYNSARIQLSERARELASLRVFGFTNQEVARVLLLELGIVIALAQPLGWVIGFGLAAAMARGFESDLFRIPLIVDQSTYATASLVVIVAGVASALMVTRRVTKLDLVRVLKTRE